MLERAARARQNPIGLGRPLSFGDRDPHFFEKLVENWLRRNERHPLGLVVRDTDECPDPAGRIHRVRLDVNGPATVARQFHLSDPEAEDRAAGA